MRKTDKKIENALRESLTQVCDYFLHRTPGFVWLTHLVDYKDYPGSLKIVCVFQNDAELARLLSNEQEGVFYSVIAKELQAANIVIKNIRQYVSFDTEEACEKSHQGNWNERFKRLGLH